MSRSSTTTSEISKGPGRVASGGVTFLGAVTFVAALSSTLSWSERAYAGDPYLEWYTLETPHFRVHYHGGLEEAAQRTATLAEEAHRALVPELGFEPHEYVNIVLSDTSEFANGSATPLPYDTVRLFVTAPDDMSVLSDYDDWLDTLITHEYTHILQLDHTAGFSAVVNAIFGKILTPNTDQPRFLTEGLAVLEESEHTTGGRMRSSQFDMMLRMDVLEHRMARLDQVSNPALRWPGGNLWYLYGSHFLGWVHDVYGEDVSRAVTADYAYSVIPYGINRSMRRVTGRTYEELWVGWRAYVADHYEKQARAVHERGLIEGTRLTKTGQATLRSRRAPACFRSEPTLLFEKNDGHQTGGIYELPLDASGTRAVGKPELLVRTNGSTFTFDGNCDLVYDNIAVSERRYALFDLYRQKRGTSAPRGTESSRERLSDGSRLREPDVSPDGKHVVFVANDAGTTTLGTASFDAEGKLTNVRQLVKSERYEQVYTPRFSPDGKSVAYGVWTRGGYRDIRLLDLASGRVFQITRDRAVDQQPAFSPDGRFLYFTSDRTGIANVYEYELASRQLSQVTNVVGGAYLPELSADGRLLYYTGYTSRGFDLYVLPLDGKRNLRALPPLDRPAAQLIEKNRRWAVRPYDPLQTLAPRSFRLGIGTGTFGTTISVTASGRDAIDRHAFVANFSIDFTRGIPQGSLTYVYDRLPAVLRMDAFHQVVPRTAQRSLENQPILETLNGFSSGVTYDMPRDFSIHSVALSYSVQHFDQELDFERKLDPYAALPAELEEGQLGLVHVGYGYSSAERTNFSVGSEKGYTLGLGADYASSATASDDTLYSGLAQATGYFLMPWFRHNVVALGASGGTSAGSYPRRGPFYTGGFVDQGMFQPFISNVRQGAFVLRGYEPTQFSGSSFALFNAEYRFPFWYADRGVSTLPVYLRKMSGVFFTDYGGAFDELALDDPGKNLHLGVGTEVWFDFVLGYVGSTNVRVGYAKGLSPLAPPPQVYFVAASGF